MDQAPLLPDCDDSSGALAMQKVVGSLHREKRLAGASLFRFECGQVSA